MAADKASQGSVLSFIWLPFSTIGGVVTSILPFGSKGAEVSKAPKVIGTPKKTTRPKSPASAAKVIKSPAIGKRRSSRRTTPSKKAELLRDQGWVKAHSLIPLSVGLKVPGMSVSTV
eukprot:CAMPEP_0184312322 /NCGR_PEP_ID=MMETSP1049-20130417/49066_1 /TAXON_ID=77928 /ORGANISM="Proteomonas sulcata, Strain CCMP704" /LENGTH=116 /DNA_ID=CAMNT_0026628389 /DNA_START=96 /DNA_END=447 /DNA_ORIENTATION=+